MESDNPGSRRLNADDVNRLASELDGQPYEAQPVTESGTDAPVSATPSSLFQDESDTHSAGALFPPEQEANDVLGGSPEDRTTLREEMTN